MNLNGKKPYKKKFLRKKIKMPQIPAPDPETGLMVLPPAEEKTVLELIQIAIAHCGGAVGFARWCEANKDVFYEKIMPRAMPLQIAGEGGGPLIVQVVDPVDGKMVYEAKWTKELMNVKGNTDSDAGKLDTKRLPAAAIPGVHRKAAGEERGGSLAKKSR